jgi:RNA polymerase sigma-70 factor (ECF subfamily)
MDSTPASLLLRLRRPADTEAWPRFVRLFTPLLDRWAQSLGLSEADSADLLQDVFLTLIKRLPHLDYDGARSFRSWLWTVLHNAFLDQRRKRGALPLPSETLDKLSRPESHPDLSEAEYQRYLVNRAVQIMQRDFTPTTWKAFWAEQFASTGRTGRSRLPQTCRASRSS